MPTITRASDRGGLWIPSSYNPKVLKIELFKKNEEGRGRTLLSRLYPGHKAPAQYSDSFWDIFVLSGDLEVGGESLGARDHFLCYPYQDVAYRTVGGCELLIFVRSNHWWSDKTPKGSQATRMAAWSWVDSKNDPKAQKVNLYDGRNRGRSMISRVGPGESAGSQWSDLPWDIFVLQGDLTVNGCRCDSGDHVLCEPHKQIAWATDTGCASLVLVRGNHQWGSC